ncbi:MAG: hypothetical protein GX781_06690 [Clostridiales bacterium]|nr:hypothetical protein [Clostridiales bacterium]
MKKLVIFLLIVLFISLPSVLAEILVHVVDQTDTFSKQEIASLEKKMQSIYDTYDFDTVIVTTDNSRGQTAQMYAADFYDEFRSYSDYPNGLIFSFNFDIGEYYEATRGLGIKIFSEQGEDALDSLLRPYLTDRNYYGAMTSYLSYIENRLSSFSQVNDDGTVTLGTTQKLPSITESISRSFSYLPIMFVIGIIVGTAAAFIMKSRLQIAKPQSAAHQYSKPGSLSLRNSSDMYLYQTVTRTRIQENKSSGGGGSTFTSSGGGSYGGRGGKL